MLIFASPRLRILLTPYPKQTFPGIPSVMPLAAAGCGMNGAMKLLVAKTPPQGGGEAELENAIRFRSFCGKPAAVLVAPKAGT
ncbi:MAG TPA: hypothetical protein VF957_19870 [Bradyrhizobium sp.]